MIKVRNFYELKLLVKETPK